MPGRAIAPPLPAHRGPRARAVIRAARQGALPALRAHWYALIPDLRRQYIESEMGYRDIITIEAGKRGGKPCIRGLRITVYDVLDYLASGMTESEILSDFPDLNADDIRACLHFAADRERKLVSLPPE